MTDFLKYPILLTQNVIGEIADLQFDILHQLFCVSYFIGVSVAHSPKRHQTDCIWIMQIQEVLIFKKIFLTQAMLVFLHK